jgi:putative FmdB family regulatory protein
MPIYEYECQGCLEKFQKLMKLNQAAPDCPSCSSEDVKKQISIGSFVLKGGGWYKDGYGLNTRAKS